MANPQPFDDVLLELETLKATLAVREYFLSAVVTDIYENTGQLLSAVRVQLALLEKKIDPKIIHQVHHTGKMVSQSIVNLRAMSRNFYPEDMLRSAPGFVEAVKRAGNGLHHAEQSMTVSVDGTPHDLNFPAAIFLFNAVLETISLLQKVHLVMTTINISFSSAAIEVRIDYEGIETDLDQSLVHVINLIGGTIIGGAPNNDLNSIFISIFTSD